MSNDEQIDQLAVKARPILTTLRRCFAMWIALQRNPEDLIVGAEAADRFLAGGSNEPAPSSEPPTRML